MIRNILKIAGVIMLTAFLFGCDSGTANSQEHAAQSNQTEIYNTNGQQIPNYPYSNYRQSLIEIENQLALGKNTTWTVYSLTMTGDLYVCKSQGWPIPVTTSLSNPSQIDFSGNPGGGWSDGVVGQMDPDGVYPPPSGNGTWVLCLDNAGVPHPLYAEGFVTAFPYEVVIDANNKVRQVGQPSADSAINGCNYNPVTKKCAP